VNQNILKTETKINHLSEIAEEDDIFIDTAPVAEA
jgi:hypothetical protein